MSHSTNNAPPQSRPYRSHRVPACIRCRSRKTRCHIDIPGEPCLSCRERRLKCQYIEASTTTSPDGIETPPSRAKRPRKNSRNADHGDEPARPRSAPILHKPSTHPSASIILAPHMAEDVDILQRHISQHQQRAPSTQASETYQTLTHDALNPIVYLTVPRFRTGLAPELDQQLEIIQQLMGPFKTQVIDLFMEHVHPSFPILGDESCDALCRGEHDKLNKNTVCVVYAVGTLYWYQSDALKMHPKPDMHYIWNKAISAILQDFLSPSLSTVAAAVLDQIGRPSVNIVGNLTVCGQTVSLAQTFGLHRDPSNWNITASEKSTRIRIWWGVLITDYWTSIAYGVLPHTSKRFYDVPIPTLASLVPPRATSAQKYATTCFIHLCGLTELLGDILPLVYEVNPDRVALSKEVDRLKRRLDGLESELPEWLPLPHKPGTSNLWLCFLSMRLLLSRVTLRAAILSGPDTDRLPTYLDELRTASSAVLDFILFLGEYQFRDFWLPYATHLLVHAVTVSLRCTVETQDSSLRNSCVVRLERVMAHILEARDKYDWDIAIYTLERCYDPVSKIASLIAQSAQPAPTAEPSVPEASDTGPLFDDAALLSDLLDPNAFDLSWVDLWDTPSGMGMAGFSI